MTQPTTLVIFGVSGDLAGRKLMPALYQLLAAGNLPDDFHVIGAARREVTADGLIETTKKYVGGEADPAILKQLKSLIQIVRMDSGNKDDYDGLLAALREAEGDAAGATRLLYLSVPPNVAGKVVSAFEAVGIAAPESRTTRLLMEKPFGSDLESAEELARHLHAAFHEENIYRIDHYVAKETTQNLVTIRRNSPQIEAIWNNQNIDRIEIEASEKIGIEGRADFYEQTGALRDLIQSHLLALMALTMMDLPGSEEVAAIHDARVKLLEAVKPITPEALSRVAERGQYEGYREEVGNPQSNVETFARLHLEVGTTRWRGVPVVIQTGKALAEKRTEIRLILKGESDGITDIVRFRLSEPEGVELRLAGKQPGLHDKTEPITLSYDVPDDERGRQPDGYERVLSEAFAGDRTNFTCGDEVLATWQIVEPVLQAWGCDGEGLESYPQGSSGPKEDGVAF